MFQYVVDCKKKSCFWRIDTNLFETLLDVFLQDQFGRRSPLQYHLSVSETRNGLWDLKIGDSGCRYVLQSIICEVTFMHQSFDWTFEHFLPLTWLQLCLFVVNLHQKIQPGPGLIRGCQGQFRVITFELGHGHHHQPWNQHLQGKGLFPTG